MSLELPPPTPGLSEWLRAARAPYLNFLRNLTPQILLASLAWVLASKLDFGRFDLSNTTATAGFWVFLVLFCFSVYANTSLFLTELFPGLMPWISEYERALMEDKVPTIRIPRLLLKAALTERKLELILAAISIPVLQFVLAGVIVSSIGSALAFIKTNTPSTQQQQRAHPLKDPKIPKPPGTFRP